MKKVIVCGGRGYREIAKVERTLDALQKEIGGFFLISGGGTGTDAIAETWAKSRGLPFAVVAANWSFFGTAAGPVRNIWMLRLTPDLVVAFPGGPGTANMIEQAEKEGVEVRRIE